MIVMLLAMGVSFSGCINPDNPQSPTTQPFVTIEPTPMPTAKPTATPVAAPIVQQKSSDVKILDYLGNNGIANFSFVKATDYQTEAITVVLRDDGPHDVQNVVLDLTETDAHGGNDLWEQKFVVGNLSRGEPMKYVMNTDKHSPASSVYLSVSITWGEHGEYVSPVTFINTARTIWMSDIPA